MAGNFVFRGEVLSWSFRCAGGVLLTAALALRAGAVQDVLLQTSGGKIVTGIVDDQTFLGTLGGRVHRGQFLSNFRSANPGFVALSTGHGNLPPGVAGFPSNHDVRFDFVPMRIGLVMSNLYYWNGSDADGNGLDPADVAFVTPVDTRWEVFDADFNLFAAAGTNALVSGGLIDRTSADIDPSDGVDTGGIHRHLVLQLVHEASASPPEGIYLIAWQARAHGFETSDPFVFVHRTPNVSDAARDIAADWVEARLEARGDYNGNGVVDAADYTVWRDHLGITGTAGMVPGDGTGDNLDGMPDGDVDIFDYELWSTNFGQAALFGSAGVTIGSEKRAAPSVPEPSTILLLAALVVGTVCWRWACSSPR